jgi:hypothetical protein
MLDAFVAQRFFDLFLQLGRADGRVFHALRDFLDGRDVGGDIGGFEAGAAQFDEPAPFGDGALVLDAGVDQALGLGAGGLHAHQRGNRQHEQQG